MFERGPKKTSFGVLLATGVGGICLGACGSPELPPPPEPTNCATSVKLKEAPSRGGQVILSRPDNDPAPTGQNTCVYLTDGSGSKHPFTEGAVVILQCPLPGSKPNEAVLVANFGGDETPQYQVQYTAPVSNPANLATLTAHCPAP